MKYYVVVLLSASAAMGQQDRLSTHTYDVNGNPMSQITSFESNKPGAERKQVTVQNVNGRQVPVQSVSEKVVSNTGGVRVIERTIQRFDANGQPAAPDKVRIEERKAADGTGTVSTTVMRSDINGNYSVAERSMTDIRKSGSVTTSTTTIERQGTSGSLEQYGKVEETRREGANGDYSSNVATYQRDLNGRMDQTAREDIEHKKQGDAVLENTARYEATNGGSMQLVRQEVSRSTKVGPRGERKEVDVFVADVAGQARSASDNRPQLREQQIIEKTPTSNGAVETMSVRTTSPNSPNQLGPARKVQETTCTGECK